MNNNSTEAYQSVIALLKTDNKLKAVELQRQNGSFKILWAKNGIENDLDWQAFGTGCGLRIKTGSQEQTSHDKYVVVGYDSTGTAFYQVNIPPVDEREISEIVNFQAEGRFPLPANQMELAWRTNKLNKNQMAITIAAARKQTVNNFIEKVRILHPKKAILDSEAIVKVWKELFSGHEKNVVIINAGTHSTQICLAENGLLCNAVTLDLGTVDFGHSESHEGTQTIERLVRDTRSVVDLFGLEKQFEIPVYVLSDGSEIYETLALSLRKLGMNARSATPSLIKLGSDNKLDLKELFEYRAPIGLALMALDNKTEELNLFTNLFKTTEKERKQYWFYSPTITGAVAAVLVLLFVMVSYGVVATGSRTIHNELNTLGSDTEINDLVKKQKLLKEIASQRVDILALINEITESGQKKPNAKNNSKTPGTQPPNPQPEQNGIELESIHFKKNNPVTITGQVQNKEQLENFEKNLQSCRDISNVLPTAKPNSGNANRSKSNGRTPANNKNGNPAPPPPAPPGNPGGGNKKGFTYTITFDYKNFTARPRR